MNTLNTVRYTNKNNTERWKWIEDHRTKQSYPRTISIYFQKDKRTVNTLIPPFDVASLHSIRRRVLLLLLILILTNNQDFRDEKSAIKFLIVEETASLSLSSSRTNQNEYYYRWNKFITIISGPALKFKSIPTTSTSTFFLCSSFSHDAISWQEQRMRGFPKPLSQTSNYTDRRPSQTISIYRTDKEDQVSR